MRELERRHWEHPHHVAIQSLVWAGDDLVDWVGGGYRFHPDGSVSSNVVNYAYTFDRAVGSPNGTYAVIFTERGTKGLVLKDEFPGSTDWRHLGARILRQINRDFYHANHYDYPVALGRLWDGRDILVHCPDSYTHLEIEEVDSGRRLTAREPHQADFFHSRLQISADGHYLLSAGWVWQPLDVLLVFDLQAVLSDPTTLDGHGVMDPTACAAEVEFAAFDGNHHLLVMGSAEAEQFDDDPEALGQSQLGRWSLEYGRWETRVSLAEPVGILMPMGTHAIGFYEHPKLIDVTTGDISHRWTDLRTGRHGGSYGVVPPQGENATPPLALDPLKSRFAVADATGVAAIQLG
jgi:hypothetical protein